MPDILPTPIPSDLASSKLSATSMGLLAKYTGTVRNVYSALLNREGKKESIMDSYTPGAQFEIPQDTLKKLQNIVDIMAALMNIPAALIMRLVDTDIEVFLSSQSHNNPIALVIGSTFSGQDSIAKPLLPATINF
jgi:hypothetical protein